MSFQFQQFYIDDTHCSHKVGTDGVLLGAWADLQDAQHILDIGCGSGLISLIAAQRSRAIVTGVEINSAAAEDATRNAKASPWSERIRIINQDVRDFQSPTPFDVILSNPPFFQETLLPPDEARAQARHTALLPLYSLLKQIDRLGSEDVWVYLIVPNTLKAEVCKTSAQHGLFIVNQTDVYTKASKPCRRLLLKLMRKPQTSLHDKLILQEEDGSRSTQYSTLTKDLYLPR
ncbi:MAG: methyltransferase [Alloprevotella sp.]|nr:methyltransferase [Alloprevotella sp.]